MDALVDSLPGGGRDGEVLANRPCGAAGPVGNGGQGQHRRQSLSGFNPCNRQRASKRAFQIAISKWRARSLQSSFPDPLFFMTSSMNLGGAGGGERQR